MKVRTKPTGHRVLIITSDDPRDWWDIFYNYVKPDVNDLDMQYADKYKTVADELLYKLCCCGWEEEERGTIEVLNPICVHRGDARLCTNPDKLAALHLKELRCTDGVRLACAASGHHYQARYVLPMLRNYVWLRKIGPIRGLSRRD